MKYLLQGEESKRLNYRKVQNSDFEIWLEFFKDPVTKIYWKTTSDDQDPRLECKQWYNKQYNRYANDKGGMNALIEKSTKQLIGHCGIQILTLDGVEIFEIGYSVLPKYWGNGYASEAAKKSRDYAFQHNFSEQLFSVISLDNLPSQAVAKKNGMRIITESIYKSNEVYLFGITKEEWNDIKDENNSSVLS